MIGKRNKKNNKKTKKKQSLNDRFQKTINIPIHGYYQRYNAPGQVLRKVPRKQNGRFVKVNERFRYMFVIVNEEKLTISKISTFYAIDIINIVNDRTVTSRNWSETEVGHIVLLF